AGLTAGVTAPLLGLGAVSAAAATSFSTNMANVQTLLTDLADGGTARTQELSQAVQTMAMATGKSTDDLAGGLYQVISAFGDTSDTVGILQINAQAAAAGLATTEQAIALTSSVTKGYGDTSQAAVQQVADLAFQTVKLGQTTFPELASAMGSVVPLAASLGASQEELFGVMATATGVTGSASEVSTQLRGVLQSLMAPTGNMAELIKSMGYESGAAMLQQEGLQGTIAAIVAAAEATGDPLQKYIGSIEGQTLALALAGPQADAFSEKLAAMGTAAGAADAAFAGQTQGVGATAFAMQQMQQSMAVVAQDLGAALIPALSAAMTAAQPLIDRII
ncbi:MAG: phage tail tape measure protein, partial [Caldilineaceae bacterium]|nr:phage tail tape measure protein [Caldilineaceae bacterium]